jgi:hypothetical protein
VDFFEGGHAEQDEGHVHPQPHRTQPRVARNRPHVHARNLLRQRPGAACQREGYQDGVEGEKIGKHSDGRGMIFKQHTVRVGKEER